MDIELLDGVMVVGTIYHQILKKYSKMYQAMLKHSKKMNNKITTQLDIHIFEIKNDDICWDKVLEIINAQPFILDVFTDLSNEYDDSVLILVLKLAKYFVMDKLQKKIEGVLEFLKLSDYIHLPKPNQILHINTSFENIKDEVLYKKDNHTDIWSVTDDNIPPNIHLADILYYATHDRSDNKNILYNYFSLDYNPAVNIDIDGIIKNFMEKYGNEQFYVHVSDDEGYDSLISELHRSSLLDMKGITKFTDRLTSSNRSRYVGYCFHTGKYVGHLKCFGKEYPVYNLMFNFSYAT